MSSFTVALPAVQPTIFTMPPLPRSSSVSKVPIHDGVALAADRATESVTWVTFTFIPALTLVVSVNSVAALPTVNVDGTGDRLAVSNGDTATV